MFALTVYWCHQLRLISANLFVKKRSRTMKTLQILAASVAACTMLPCYAAAPVLDQSSAPDAGSPITLAVGGPSGQVLAQTLTAAIGGRLAEVRLPIGCASGELVLQVKDVALDGKPGTTVLATRRYPADLFPAVVTVDFQSLPLGGRVGLTPGDRIALVLSNPTGSCGVYPGVPSGYTDGDGWTQDPTFGWQQLLISGSSATDIGFQTFVRMTEP
jgi:hypothetical protein